jgi:hypothetical protein
VRITLTDEDSRGIRPWRAIAPLTTGRLVETLRGTLLGARCTRPHLSRSADGIRLDLEWHTRGVDRDVLHREFVAAVPYRVLTDEGLPRCLIATAAPDVTAIVTPRGQEASFRVHEDARFERLAAWPSPIVGEVHGPQGAVAWTFTQPALLLFRDTPTSEVVPVPVPFQTYTAVWWQNHVVLTTNDGLWMWQPGRPPTKIVDLAPSVIVQVDGDSVEVDPLPIEAGRLTRARLARGWTVDLGTSAVAARELPAPGQRWMLHAAAERSVTSFPQADCIRVTLRAGAEWTLVWPSPRAALWVGASLMVNTTSGEVVFFEGLGDRPEFMQS